MQWSDVVRRPPDRTLRSFAALCAVVFGGLASWRWWMGAGGPATIALAIGAAGVGVTGLIHPPAVRWVFTGWLIAVFPVSWTVSRAVLGLVFFGLFTPTAVVARLAGRDVLRRGKPAATLSSHWLTRRGDDRLERYLRQF
ncbi:MAG: SxtJ family membrane protein [Vicinamibacterales bacterium]